MLLKNTQKYFLYLLFLIFVSLGFSACSGGLCASLQSALLDIDSDCVADAADNCPVHYNPSQFDGDDDGLGLQCDIDDTDEATGPIRETDWGAALTTGGDSSVLISASQFSGNFTLEQTECNQTVKSLSIFEFQNSLSIQTESTRIIASSTILQNGATIFTAEFDNSYLSYGVLLNDSTLKIIHHLPDGNCSDYYAKSF